MAFKKETLELISLVIDVTDEDYQYMMKGIKDYYLKTGTLSDKQKSILSNAVTFRLLNV